MKNTGGPKHVVIVGGGFAGVGCAGKLASQKEVRVTLIDKNNYNQFQPLLYQVATSLLTPDDVAVSLRKLFWKSSNVDVKLAEAVAVDPMAKAVTTSSGEVYQGDYLVLAAGSQPNFFRAQGAEGLGLFYEDQRPPRARPHGRGPDRVGQRQKRRCRTRHGPKGKILSSWPILAAARPC